MNDKKPDSYVVCIDNTDYTASLEKHKIYRVVRNEAAVEDGDIWVIDESGEDYLYPTARFVPVSVPAEVKNKLAHDSTRD